MSESEILQKILMSFTRKTNNLSRIFRNNTGQAWQGKQIGVASNGSVTLQFPRRIRYGLCKGSSDAIGWTTIKITPEMVGENIAVFTAVETKDKSGRASDEQVDFLKAVNNAGGFGVLAKSLDDVLDILREYIS